MNLPNKLSIFRILLMPIMLLVYYLVPGQVEVLNISTASLILCIIFIIGSLTDYIDGKIARKNNLITDFGKFIDPLADKVLVLTALVILVEMGIVPAWIPVIVLTREFAVSGYRLVAASKSGNVIAASKWGKIKTVSQMIAITFMFLNKYKFFEFIKLSFEADKTGYILNLIGSILLLFSVIATIFSGWDYLKHGKDILKDA